MKGKKMKKKVCLWRLLVLVIGIICACISVSAATENTIAFKRNYSDSVVKAGSQKKVYVVNTSGKTISASKIIWETSNPKVATVNKGVITTKKYGKTYISAKLKNGKSNTIRFKLHVYQSRRKVSITNIDENYVLKVGKSRKIIPSVKTSYCRFTSSDPSVVTVNKNGVMKGIKAGKATITYLSVEKYAYKTSIDITVGKRIKSIKSGLSDDVLTLNVGGTYQIKPQISPSNAAVKKIKYSMDVEGVISVSENLVIKAEKEGVVNISMKPMDGGAGKGSLNVVVLNPQTDQDSGGRDISLIGHRGLAGMAPENTLASFELAGMLGVDEIECDVQVTKDGYVVIMHDESLLRMCGVDKKISDITFEELRTYPIVTGMNLDKYEKLYVPTLEEFIECCNKYNCRPVIEIKGTFNDVSLQKVYATISKSVKKPVVISFYRYNLRWMRAKDPGIGIRNLVKVINQNEVNFCKEINAEMSVKVSGLNENYIKRLQTQNIAVSVWGVKTSEEYEFFKTMKVDSVCVDEIYA